MSTSYSTGQRTRLRYTGTCRGCRQSIPAGHWAAYHLSAKQVECLGCSDTTAPPDLPNSVDRVATPVTGTAGASARREYERQVAKHEERLRSKYPRLGGLFVALSGEPQSTRAWATGARGEELLATRLDTLAVSGVLTLHDRRIPRTRANIDHIAVGPAGVFVLDAKRYRGHPDRRADGGFLRPRTETLTVGRRDCTKLLDGMKQQLSLVRAVLTDSVEYAEVPLRGMLCFVEADWPLIGGSFTIHGVDVLWPAKAAKKLAAEGPLTAEHRAAIHRRLADAFPPA
ncbi:MAG: nuclease-related domain-containing protein [Mycobacteriaceae bacterium]